MKKEELQNDEEVDQNDLCYHNWITITKQNVYVGDTGNSITGGSVYYKTEYIQECEKCGKYNRV